MVLKALLQAIIYISFKKAMDEMDCIPVNERILYSNG